MTDIYRVTCRHTYTPEDPVESWDVGILYCGEDRTAARAAYHTSTPYDCENKREECFDPFIKGKIVSVKLFTRRTILEIIRDGETDNFADDSTA